MGLQRNPSDESSISRGRRLSNDTEAESTSTFPEKPIMAPLEDVTRSARKPFLAEPIPESPRQPDEVGKKLFTDAGAVSDKPSTNPDKQVDEEESSPALLPAEPAEKPQPSKSSTETPPAAGGANGKPKAEKAKDVARAAGAAAKAPATAVKKATTKPSTISTKSTTQPPARSPATTAPKKTETRQPAKPSERAAAKKETSTVSRASAAATKSAASGATKRPQPIKIGEKSDTGFVKPKPKSPTKPVNLPSSLMAHTASSVSKGNAPPRQTLSRQAGNLNAPGRPQSRASTSTAPAPAKTVRRRPSNISHPRPSIGPPPKKATQQEGSTAKRADNVDEGFLARMMRPTQASSSKTSEKAPLTPPRRNATRASTSERSVSSRRESSTLRATGSQSPAVKPAEKSAPQTTLSVPAQNVAPQTAAAETAEEATTLPEMADLAQTPVEPSAQLPAETVHETANVETAEEATALAEEAELVQTPVEPQEVKPAPAPEAESVPEAEPVPVEEIAPETANVETAEEAIDLAQEADLVQTPVVSDESVAAPAEAEPAGPQDVDTAASASSPVQAVPEPAANDASEIQDESTEEVDDQPSDAPAVQMPPSDIAPAKSDTATEKQHEVEATPQKVEEEEEEEEL